jgi:hypothetical protein
MKQKAGSESTCEGWGSTVRESLLVVSIAAVVGLAVNSFLNPNGIPIIAERQYEVLVPCPEPGGKVTPVEVIESQTSSERVFWLDARSEEDFNRWHHAQAANVAYDYLDPTPSHIIEELARNIARSKAQRVFVYGDGDDPDTGEQLAREISGKGIRNVFFIKGGAPALRGQEEMKR